VQQVDDMVDQLNLNSDQVAAFQAALDEKIQGLQDYIDNEYLSDNLTTILNDWNTNGTLAQLTHKC
jgi:hypothetical protein